MTWWHGAHLALAIDATYQRDRWVILSVSVLYRGSAIPVAWEVVPANTPADWATPICRLLEALDGAVPPSMLVIVPSDRGLWSARLWRAIQQRGWHPVMRVRQETTFAPVGQPRQSACGLISGPGAAWIGSGTAFKERRRQLAATLVAVWVPAHDEPWLMLTDLSPSVVGAGWYGLRCWIEVSFRQIKRFGWNWHRTRRADPVRIARHWLVVAVASLWTLAYGTRLEDAERRQMNPAHLRRPTPPQPPRLRHGSVFARGLTRLRHHLATARSWRHLWLTPDDWPFLQVPVPVTVVDPLDSS